MLKRYGKHALEESAARADELAVAGDSYFEQPGLDQRAAFAFILVAGGAPGWERSYHRASPEKRWIVSAHRIGGKGCYLCAYAVDAGRGSG
jgi:hypothetical protein